MTTIPRPDTLGVNTARLVGMCQALKDADLVQDAESYVAVWDTIDELLDQRLHLLRQRTP